jgi:hypothetical protein
MMGLLLIGVISILLIWITSHLRIFIRNYNAARATGLPIVICPYDPDSVSTIALHIPRSIWWH